MKKSAYRKKGPQTAVSAPKLLVVVVIGVTVLLSGCRTRLNPSGEQPAQAAQQLTVAITTDVETWYLDKFPEGDARFVWAQVYETLVRLTPDLKLTEGLATSWEADADGKVWTFHLRPGVTFHDGTPFNAAAVAFSYGKQSYAARTILRPLKRVEVVDNHTVRFILSRPMPLPYYLTHIGWPVMSPSCVDDRGQFVAPVGTGPFRFKSQTTDQEIVLVRNNHYWGGRPQLQEVIFKILPEASARVIGLEAGDLDMIVKVPESEVARLTAEAGTTVHRTLSTFTDFLQFNCEQAPFDDVRLRRAVAAAIDTEQLADQILEGVGQPAYGGPLSPVLSYYCPDLKLIQHNPQQARQLIAEAGWRDRDGDGIVEKHGAPLTTRLLVNPAANVGSGSRFVLMAEAIQGQLRDVGIDVQIKVLERGAFLQAEAQEEFEMLLRTGFYLWGAYPRHFFLHFSGNEYSHYSDPEYDQLITQADATVDREAQRKLYWRLQRETLARLPAFYLVHEEKVVATRACVAGYQISAEPPWLNLAGIHIRSESQ